MPNATKALELVELIYDAAIDRQDWSLVIGALTEATGGHSGLMRLVDCRRASEGFVAAYGYDKTHLEAYREHFVHIDPYRDRLTAAPIGALLQSDREAPLCIRQHTEYFNDYESPNDRIHALGSPLAREKDFLLYLGLCRGCSIGPYDEESLQFVRTILPHISRAVQFQRLIGSAVDAQQLCETALDQLRVGVVLLNSAGQVSFANSSALELTTKFGIGIGEAGLVVPNLRFNAHLQRMIGDAIALENLRSGNAGGDLTFAHPYAGFLQIRVFPISPKSKPILNRKAVQIAVFLVKPGTSQLTTGRLTKLFGLTVAESNLATHLTKGETVAEAARITGISIATARTHLRSIFAKTGTSRQAELALLLLSSLAGLTHDTHSDDGQR